MRRSLRYAVAFVVFAIVGVLIYSLATDDAAALCREFSACGAGAP